MTVKDKMETRRSERYLKKESRQKIFTWTYRYLRLHRELLDDSLYQGIFDYVRKTLILYLRRDMEGLNKTDEEYGGVLDLLTDIYNENGDEFVNEYKVLVEELYKFFKKNPNALKDIFI